jgi:hypothetical protein
MPKIWVDALFPGTWTLQNGEQFHCAPEDAHYYDGRMKEMLAAGATIPWCWEHQPTVGLSQEDRVALQAKHQGGHCHGCRLSPDGHLQILMGVDDADVPALRRNGFVSPEIRHNVYDGRTGQRWAGPSIAHLAITPRPVQTPAPGNWKPHIPLSASAPVSLRHVTVDLSLSQARYAPAKDSKMPMPPPKPADKPEGDAPGKPEDDLDIDDIEGEEDIPPPPAAADGPNDQAGADAARMHNLSQAIAELGMVVEPTAGMTLQSYVDHLCTAVKTHKATKALPQAGAATPPAQPDPNSQPPADEPLPEVAETPPVMMSTAMSNALQAENAALKARLGEAVKIERRALADRIRAHHGAGNLGQKHANELIGKLKTVSLSNVSAVSDAVLTDIKRELATLDRLAADGRLQPAFGKTTSLSTAGVDDAEVEETMPGPKADRERQEKAADEMCHYAGVPAPATATK